MRAWLLAVVALAALAAPAVAGDAERLSPALALTRAAAALEAGDYDAVLSLAVVDPEHGKSDRAEAHRLRGLAHFFLEQFDIAEADFLDYLKLELDGGLDPALYPPEAVTFFEDVRSRHAAELRKLRPRQRRWRVLNLLPPVGQAQNREYTKALVLGGAEVVLAATHLTTYLVLRSWCGRNDFTCVSGGDDVPETARKLKIANYISGVALIGVYVYGVIDGFRGFKRRSRERAQPVFSAAPVEGGVVVGASLSF